MRLLYLLMVLLSGCAQEAGVKLFSVTAAAAQRQPLRWSSAQLSLDAGRGEVVP
jgi:hypothetical protein